MSEDDKPSPIRPTDDEARGVAKHLIESARLTALAVLHPESGGPFVSRTAVATASNGQPVSLISDLSLHTRALKASPKCSLLLGEPGQDGAKGDPLNQARITLQCEARFLTRDDPEEFAEMQKRYLSLIPKATIYANFLDFNFAVFDVKAASLNGGFGKAFELTPADLGL